MQINGEEVNPNPLIHGSWFGIGRGEKSCYREMWRLILSLKRGGDGHRTEEGPKD